MYVLGIETSCDETAAAVVEDGRRVMSNVISSQIELHRAHGGVVPELAARGQVEAIIPVVEAAIGEAGIEAGDIHAIAYTQGPGLAGSLLVGVNAAKAFAFSLGKPAVPVNHLEGHVYANWLANGPDDRDVPTLPAVCLLVSGGHTALVAVRENWTLELLGQTLDDAAGEAFDKGARLLGLGYPGGPAIQRASQAGDRDRFDLPRSALPGTLNFSFSGLKTALLRASQPFRVIEAAPPERSTELFPTHRPPRFRDDAPIAGLAASFEHAIVDALVAKTLLAARQLGARTIMLAGGVAANALLRRELTQAVQKVTGWGVRPEVRWPDIAFCTDNAAMIAGLGYGRFLANRGSSLADDARPRYPIAGPDHDLHTLE